MRSSITRKRSLRGAVAICVSLLPLNTTAEPFGGSELGDPSSFSSLEALQGRAWDKAILNPFAILYASRKSVYNMEPIRPLAIAIARRENSSVRFLLSKKTFDKVTKDPSALVGLQVLATGSSASHMHLLECLAYYELKPEQMEIGFANQTTSMATLDSGKTEAAVLWRSFDRRAEDGKSKAKELKCGGEPSLLMPALWVTRSDLLLEPEDGRRQKNLRELALRVATELGKWEQIRRVPEPQAKKLIEWYRARGVTIEMAEALQEIDERRPPSFDEQLTLFHSPRQDPSVAAILDQLSDYLVSSGALRLDEKPDADTVVDGSVLDYISADPSLAAVARGETPPVQ